VESGPGWGLDPGREPRPRPIPTLGGSRGPVTVGPNLLTHTGGFAERFLGGPGGHSPARSCRSGEYLGGRGCRREFPPPGVQISYSNHGMAFGRLPCRGGRGGAVSRKRSSGASLKTPRHDPAAAFPPAAPGRTGGSTGDGSSRDSPAPERLFRPGSLATTPDGHGPGSLLAPPGRRRDGVRPRSSATETVAPDPTAAASRPIPTCPAWPLGFFEGEMGRSPRPLSTPATAGTTRWRSSLPEERPSASYLVLRRRPTRSPRAVPGDLRPPVFSTASIRAAKPFRAANALAGLRDPRRPICRASTGRAKCPTTGIGNG